MIRGSCHCGAVRFTLLDTPAWLTECNCSYCRRARALWAHTTADRVTLTAEPGATIRYVWGDATLAFVSCKTCGCTTHWDSLDTETTPRRMAINCAMAEPGCLDGLPIRHFDGAESWAFLD